MENVPGALSCRCHTGFRKIQDKPKAEGIDLYRSAGTSCMARKGTGLYASRKARLLPLIYGGGQQDGMRSGTEMYPVLNLGVAVEEAYTDFDSKIGKLFTGLKNVWKPGFPGLTVW